MKIICPVCSEQMDSMSTRCVCGYEVDTPAAPTRSDISKEEISDNRIKLRIILNGIEITIPTRVDSFMFVRLGIGTIVWAIGEAFGLWMMITVVNVHDPDILPLILFGIWTIIGVSILHTWLWYSRGKEIIILAGSKLTIKKDTYGYGFRRVYDLNRISNLLVSYEGEGREGKQSGGAIIFDYDNWGSNTFRFGLSLNEEEAQFIVSELYKRYRFQAG